MSSTQEDSQRVEVEGIVHKVFKRGSLLYLEVNGRVKIGLLFPASNLIDSMAY
jgi:hypothetical protein